MLVYSTETVNALHRQYINNYNNYYSRKVLKVIGLAGHKSMLKDAEIKKCIRFFLDN